MELSVCAYVISASGIVAAVGRPKQVVSFSKGSVPNVFYLSRYWYSSFDLSLRFFVLHQ